MARGEGWRGEGFTPSPPQRGEEKTQTRSGEWAGEAIWSSLIRPTGWRILNYYLFLFLIAQRLSSAMAYGLAFQNYSQHMLPKNLTCSDRRLYSFDFISHAERKNAEDAFNHLVRCSKHTRVARPPLGGGLEL